MSTNVVCSRLRQIPRLLSQNYCSTSASPAVNVNVNGFMTTTSTASAKSLRSVSAPPPPPPVLGRRSYYAAKSGPPKGYSIEQRGGLFTETYRIYFCDEHLKYISPFHDIPLRVGGGSVYNMVVEIPRWSNAKMEMSRTESLNPIHQDTQDGQVRFIPNPFPYHGYLWNYGALPQTWENPHATDQHTGCKGDNDPIDVIEIGSKIHKSGSVIQVKILGALAVISQGETDWKLIAIDITDQDAHKIKGINDIDKVYPGLIPASIDWFRIYRIPDGSPPNEFAFNGVPKDAEFAYGIINQKHECWQVLSRGELHDTHIACERTGDPNSPYYISDLQALLVVNQRPPFFRAPPYDPYVHKWDYISTHREFKVGDNVIAGLFSPCKPPTEIAKPIPSTRKPMPAPNFKIDEGPEI